MDNQTVEHKKDNLVHTIVSLKDRPDLRASVDDLNITSWPKFFAQDLTSNEAWNLLFTDWSEYQVAALDKEGKVLGVGLTVPLVWDGDLSTLPSGWDAATQQGIDDLMAGKTPTALTAYVIMVNKKVQKCGISSIILRALLEVARSHGLHSIMVCVRPILKAMYPLIPIEQYTYWTNTTGEPFDPWMRVHARAGAKLVAPSPFAVSIQGTVSEWQEWTKMEFPASGQYIISGALTPVTIDHERNLGIYYDPNVWMLHRITSATS